MKKYTEGVDYTLGKSYTDKYLSDAAKSTNLRTRVTNVRKTKYGYIINLFSNYVTLTRVKLYINSDGSAKASVRIDKNYCPTQNVTYYFSPCGKEIVTSENSTRKELAIQKYLRSNN